MLLGRSYLSVAVACHFDEWPVLVVCPSSVRFSWHAEWKRWAPDLVGEDGAGIKVIIHGKQTILEPVKRVVQISLQNGFTSREEEVMPRVVIISYDLVKKYRDQLGQLFPVVICDESHYIKNPKAQRTKALVPLIQQSRRAILLSGTPALSRPIDLYPQISALSPKGTCTSLFDISQPSQISSPRTGNFVLFPFTVFESLTFRISRGYLPEIWDPLLSGGTSISLGKSLPSLEDTGNYFCHSILLNRVARAVGAGNTEVPLISQNSTAVSHRV